MTSYVLSAPLSDGSSKSGADKNIRLPLVALISKSCASKPPEIEKETVSSSSSFDASMSAISPIVFSKTERGKAQELFGDAP